MFHLIVNPIAGRGRAKRAITQVQEHFATHQLPLTVHLTQQQGHATQLAASLAPDAKILALGGDGTLHEVAAACIGTERTVGVLPGGSGDDFAFALGIDRRNLKQALKVITDGRVRIVDTALVNGAPFINSLGTGFDAEVGHTMLRAPRIFKERSAYLYAVIRTLSTLENIPVEVMVDNKLFYSGPALLVSVQNGPRTGGSFLFCPDAKLDDGLLDLVVAARLGRRGTLGILPKVMKGKHLGHPQVFITTGKQFCIRWQKPRVGHMEGEFLAAEPSFEITVQPKSLRVFAPV